MTAESRTESDSMGEMTVPAGAYWGAQTQRAVENFPISGLRFPRSFIRALGAIKLSAARVNMGLDKLDERLGKAIEAAATEVMQGKLDEQFPLDIFQTGSGTSTNMNANEVIANRSIQILGGSIGSKQVHPNDHVNMGQSSNDVIPTACHVSACATIEEEVPPPGCPGARHPAHERPTSRSPAYRGARPVPRHSPARTRGQACPRHTRNRPRPRAPRPGR